MKKNTNKQKVLMPTLKDRQRYIVYKTIMDQTVDFKVINDQIVHQVRSILGVFDCAKAGIMGVTFNNQTMKGIIRAENTAVDKVKVCFGMITKITTGNTLQGVLVDCDYVSGLLNKAEARMNAR
jgi:ribonuclease P/MRP protein subunit POP5